VSSRQEEKQRRRAEREAREQAEKAAAARRKRVQFALAGLGGIAAIAVVVVLALGVVGGDDTPEEGEAEAPDVSVEIPEQQDRTYEQAVEAAGCEAADPEIEGAGHEEREFGPDDYKTNPPTSGAHNPVWYEDGVYEPGTTPRLGELVHTLEHGRINVQYKPGTPANVVDQLEAVVAEQNDGYHMLLYENTTGMDAQVAATTWGHSVTCPRMNDDVFDVIRTFTTNYIDQGPENVP
jgi:Protein of unknown function (DUF3105)